MKNEEIILRERVRLMMNGLIGTTGEMMTVDTKEGPAELPEPLEIHTYAGWLQRGMRVCHGQHAVAKFPVWKMRSAGMKKDQETGEEVAYSEKMMLCEAFFFSSDQVEPLPEVTSGGRDAP